MRLFLLGPCKNKGISRQSWRLFLLGPCKNKGISKQSWRTIQFRRRIKNENKTVGKDCTIELKPLRKTIKQSVPRLRAVEEKQ